MINVCGLAKRIQYPEFKELIEGYDILCFVETKTDDADEINLPYFILHMKNRFTFKSVNSGGIILSYKTALSSFVNIVESESKYILWFKCNKSMFHLPQDVLIGIVYVPPENSKYCIGNPFNETENELLDFSTNLENVCIIGDWNARPCEEHDYIIANFDTFSDFLNVDNDGVQMLEELKVEIVPKSMDNRKNNLGNRLLELCRCNDICICNGRIGDDKGICKFTSKNVSVIDDAICAPLLFKIIDHFSVLETSKFFSDIHNPLSMAFICIRENTSSAIQTNDVKVEQIKNWESEKKDEFISNINNEDINELALLLNNLSEQDSGVVDNSSVNDMVNKIGSLLTNSAKTTFGTFVPGRHNKKETNKKQNHG